MSGRAAKQLLDDYTPELISGDMFDAAYLDQVREYPEYAGQLRIARREVLYRLDQYAQYQQAAMLAKSASYFEGQSDQQRRDNVSLQTIYSFMSQQCTVPPPADALVNALGLLCGFALKVYNRFEADLPGTLPEPDPIFDFAERLHRANLDYVRSGQAAVWMFTDEALLEILRVLSAHGPLTKLEYDLVTTGKPAPDPEIAFRNPVHADYITCNDDHEWLATELGRRAAREGSLHGGRGPFGNLTAPWPFDYRPLL